MLKHRDLITNQAFNTGDLLLFSNLNSGRFKNTINYYFDSIYNHIGIIIHNPPWEPEKKGYYLLHTEPLTKNTNNIVLEYLYDVFNNYKGCIYWRHISRLDSDIFNHKLEKLYYTVTEKKYPNNLYCWFYLAYAVNLNDKKKINDYWSATIVAFIYFSMGLISANVDWQFIKPDWFSSKSKNKFYNCYMNSDKLIYKYN
tara:strand:- start:332 stop:928 length:597 start_codon:yes stop_codon:yes gene_type:complete